MRFAISIPQDVTDGAFNPDRLRAYLQRAEDLGFDSAWVADVGGELLNGLISAGFCRMRFFRLQECEQRPVVFAIN